MLEFKTGLGRLVLRGSWRRLMSDVDWLHGGAGIGRQLLEAAERWAAGRGLKELASDAELDNDNSIQVHRSCGFVETCLAVHFIKRISVKPGEGRNC
jgi:GNAT superfamily N-acetyltransferase